MTNETQKITSRFGFMKEKISVPENFDHLYKNEIIEMFLDEISDKKTEQINKEKLCSTLP